MQLLSFFKQHLSVSCGCWLGGPVLTRGAMSIAERQLRVLFTSMSCTSRMVSNLVHMGEIFITSWSYLVSHLALSRTFWNFNSTGKHLYFFFTFYLLIIFGTHRIISWEMSSFQMFSFSFLISKLIYLLPNPNSSFFRILFYTNVVQQNHEHNKSNRYLISPQ